MDARNGINSFGSRNSARGAEKTSSDAGEVRRLLEIRGDPEFYRNGLVTYSFFEQRNKSSTGDLAAASLVGPACDSGHVL